MTARVVLFPLCSGCDVNRVNSKNKLPLYTAIESRADNEVSEIQTDNFTYRNDAFLSLLLTSYWLRSQDPDEIKPVT